MNEVERKVLRDLLLEEFAKHRSTSRGPDDDRWVCKCGVDVDTDERGYPLGRNHIVDRFVDVIDAMGLRS